MFPRDEEVLLPYHWVKNSERISCTDENEISLRTSIVLEGVSYDLETCLTSTVATLVEVVFIVIILPNSVQHKRFG